MLHDSRLGAFLAGLVGLCLLGPLCMRLGLDLPSGLLILGSTLLLGWGAGPPGPAK
jgi:hypothetical protein